MENNKDATVRAREKSIRNLINGVNIVNRNFKLEWLIANVAGLSFAQNHAKLCIKKFGQGK
jgi:hypothetical protein